MNKKLKIIALVENTTNNKNLSCEHGLSLYIEANDKKILFDMGQTNLFEENAKKLGVDLSQVDIAIVSHGHYDHGGGLDHFLKINTKAPVYMSKYAFGDYYNGTSKYIGLDKMLKENQRIIFTEGTVVLDKNLTLCTMNDKPLQYEIDSQGLFEKKDELYIPDTFIHEQYLCMEEQGKKILFSGCSHKGILNIMEYFRPDVFVGGFHFSKLSLDLTLEKNAKLLVEYPTDYYTCHCTGAEQYQYMKKYIDKLHYLDTGRILEIQS